MLLICSNLADGGAQRVVSNLANGWCRQSRRVALLTLDDREDNYQLEAEVKRYRLVAPRASSVVNRIQASHSSLESLMLAVSSRLYVLAVYLQPLWPLFSRLLPQLRVIQRLREQIQSIDARIIVAFLGPTNVQTVLACRGLGRKVVISERNDPARQLLAEPWQSLRPHVYDEADLVTANSRGALETLKGYVNSQKLGFAPNPLTASTSGAECDLPAPFILIVARLEPVKAHDILLPAFARLTTRLPNWRLAVVGQGSQESRLRALALSLGISDRVDWCGLVRDPFPYYRKASIFVLPSRYEGMPNALIEALSCGLPAVVSDASRGPLELVCHEHNGLVVRVDDTPALAEAMLRLALDPDLRRRMGRSAKDSVAAYEHPAALASWEQLVGLA